MTYQSSWIASGVGNNYGPRETGITIGSEGRINNELRLVIQFTEEGLNALSDFTGESFYGYTYIPAGFKLRQAHLTIDEDCEDWPEIEIVYDSGLDGPITIVTLDPSTINQNAPMIVDLESALETGLEMVDNCQQKAVLLGFKAAAGTPTSGKFSVTLYGTSRVDLGIGPVTMADQQLYRIVIEGLRIVVVDGD